MLRRLRSPLALLVVAIAVVRAVAITWGLPASDGWDDDGVAPRDFLVGLAQTFTPGSYFTYPPVHLAILAVLNLPMVLFAALRAPSFAPGDLVHAFIAVPTMTTFALVARVVSLAMSLGIVVALAKMGEELWGARVGLWTAACAGVSWAMTYYAHTSNLDVPYLFWSALALLECVRAIAREEPRRLRRVAVLVALAIGTKDQAYAVFLVSMPCAIGAWMLASRERARLIGREAAMAAGIAVALLALVDGAIVNPRGVRARIDFLLGAASQDHATYAKGAEGVARVLRDVVLRFDSAYPWVFAPFVALGIALAWRRSKGASRVAAMLPLLAAISFTLAFDCTARRTEARFVLPQCTVLAVYLGLGWERAYEWARARLGLVVARGVVAAAFAWALFQCAAVDVNLVLDPRYDAEAWLAAHVAPGDTVEVYGNNVYLPRFSSSAGGARVVRVGPEPVEKRSPLPNVVEVQGAYADAGARAPKWIVVSEAWVWRYTLPWEALAADGLALSAVQRSVEADAPSRAFFEAIHDDRGGFHRAHVSRFASAFWPRIDIHASTSREIRIFERD